jgi:acetyl-CoA carboxylase biotin carboxylase subunit
LPLLPGTTEPVAGAEEATRLADEIGYPVVLKAVAGGGGRGIAVVPDRDALPRTFQEVRAHAKQVFGNGELYLERYLRTARHVEVQVLADANGTTVHLGERDCSVQRRHQKLIEEAPSSAVDEPLRAALGEAAVRGAASIGYRGAGTMEFLLDEDGAFWFMEMNARIQVEHPVTEMVTGVDLVTEQIRTAAGQALSFGQDDVELRGHAIECRVNAEDPDRDFMPAPGRLEVFVPPGGPGTRVDTHCRPGATIPPSYDSLIAKVIVWGPDRETALDRMDRSLGEFRIEGPGVHTTIPFHRQVLGHPVFRKGELATDFLDKHLT